MTADAAVRVGLAVVVVMVVLALLFARALVGAFAKFVAVGLLSAGAIFVWSQRSQLQACADRIRDEALPTTVGSTTCEVSGLHFTVDVGH